MTNTQAWENFKDETKEYEEFHLDDDYLPSDVESDPDDDDDIAKAVLDPADDAPDGGNTRLAVPNIYPNSECAILQITEYDIHDPSDIIALL